MMSLHAFLFDLKLNGGAYCTIQKLAKKETI